MTLSRDARKAETRSALIGAAAKLFANHGIEATSLDRIASEIGLTKGAVYAHFANKKELVIAIGAAVETESEQSKLLEIMFDETLPFAERMRRMGVFVAKLTDEETPFGLSGIEVTLLDLEFLIYSLRSRDADLVGAMRRAYEEFGDRLEAIQKRRREPLAFPGSTVLPLASNLSRGLNVAHEQAPELVPTSLYERVYEALGILFTKPKRGASGASRRKPRGG